MSHTTHYRSSGAEAAHGAPGAGFGIDEGALRDVVRRIQAGERAAWGLLYETHVDAIYRAVRVLARSREEAEDVVQETFVRAYLQIPRLRWQGADAFRSWLATCALNVARRRLRWTGRVTSFEPNVHAQPVANDSDERLDRSSRMAALLAAMAELTVRDREILSLRYGAGLSAGEVAAITGVSEANVRKICERGRRFIVERVGSKDDRGGAENDG